MSQDASQNALKLAVLGAKLANIVSTWRHLGAHFRSRWPQDASKWSPEGDFSYVLWHLPARDPKMIPKLFKNVSLDDSKEEIPQCF